MIHRPVILTKQGQPWQNDLGQHFPAVPLYRFACPCGWKGAAWYKDAGRAQGHYDRHLETVDSHLYIGDGHA